MIKLIISDLDGTLLPSGETEVCREVKNLISLAAKKQIRFVVASGRAYHELKSLFKDVEGSLIFMPSDGAMTVFEEKTYFFKPLQKHIIQNVVKVAEPENLSIVFSGKYFSYYIGEDNAFLKELSSKKHIMRIYNLDDIPEEIVKLSFYGAPKSHFAKKVLSGTYTNMMKLIYSGSGWTEFISPGAGKEKATKCMMETLKISPEETLIFGNDTNDVKMLQLSPNSFSVPGSHHDAENAAKQKTEDIVKTLFDFIRKGDI